MIQKYKYVESSYDPVADNQIKITYNSTKENAKHYVMWSGGCDSTLLLYELLEHYGASNVVAVSYKYPWLFPKKYETEKMHREAIKSKLALRGECFTNFTHATFEINQISNCNLMNTQPCCSPQVTGWLLTMPVYTKANSYIYNGYIKSDGIIPSLDSYHQMFESLVEISRKTMILREPYIYYTKWQIIEKLIKYNLYDVIWYCELPKEVGVMCKECDPCRTHMSALNDVIQFSKDKFVIESAKYYLNLLTEKKSSEDSIEKKD